MKETAKKILIAGGSGSGKSTIANAVHSLTQYPITSFGGTLRSYTQSNFPNKVINLQDFGQQMIEELGFDGFLQWVIANSIEANWNSDLIIDGVRHLRMYDALNKSFSRNILIFCKCDKYERMARLIKRDGISEEKAHSIVHHELERHIDNMEGVSDIIFSPEDSVEELLYKIRSFK